MEIGPSMVLPSSQRSGQLGLTRRYKTIFHLVTEPAEEPRHGNRGTRTTNREQVRRGYRSERETRSISLPPFWNS